MEEEKSSKILNSWGFTDKEINDMSQNKINSLIKEIKSDNALLIKHLPKKEQIKEFEKDLDYTIELIKILKDKDKRKILDLCYESPLTISDLQNKTQLNYREIWQKIKILEKETILKLEKKKGEKGQPVYVKSCFKSKELPEFIAGILEGLYLDYDKSILDFE